MPAAFRLNGMAGCTVHLKMYRKAICRPPDLGKRFWPQCHGHAAGLSPGWRAGARWQTRGGGRRLRSLVAGRLNMRRAVALLFGLTLIAGCSQEAETPDPAAQATSAAPAEKPAQPTAKASAPVASADAGEATPMAERVAIIGLLNKRNNVSQDFEMKPGEERVVDDVILRLAACERTAPWEMPRETGAFVQLLVRDRGEESSYRKVFSGWLFKNSPSLNVVEHPVYDVWVKDCVMEYPGEE